MSKYNCEQVVDYCSVAVSSPAGSLKKEATGMSVLNEQAWSGP